MFIVEMKYETKPKTIRLFHYFYLNFYQILLDLFPFLLYYNYLTATYPLCNWIFHFYFLFQSDFTMRGGVEKILGGEVVFLGGEVKNTPSSWVSLECF